MRPRSHLLLTLALIMQMVSCNDSQPGVEQRVAELEARIAFKQSEINDLKARLQTGRAEDAIKPTTNDLGADDAAVGAAADDIARSLSDQLKPGQLTTSAKVAYAGFTLKTTNSSTGVAVPFFRDSAASSWRCGWSEAQIKNALSGNLTAPAPMASQPAQSAPNVVSVPISSPTSSQTTSTPSTLMTAGLPRGWNIDGSGQVIASDGTPMPALKKGERYGMIPGGSGDTPRPVVIDADGVPKLIVR